MQLKLNTIETPYNTIGVMEYGDFSCYTLELPWINNHQNISCIPAGTYECVKHMSPRFGDCISIKNVVGRTDVLIHYGNFTGDTLGCILVGESIADIDRDGIMDVASSKRTLEQLMLLMPDKFDIVINRLFAN
ncbi:MAG: DUF5675 family protein [Psychrobium sp.]